MLDVTLFVAGENVWILASTAYADDVCLQLFHVGRLVVRDFASFYSLLGDTSTSLTVLFERPVGRYYTITKSLF